MFRLHLIPACARVGSLSTACTFTPVTFSLCCALSARTFTQFRRPADFNCTGFFIGCTHICCQSPPGPQNSISASQASRDCCRAISPHSRSSSVATAVLAAARLNSSAPNALFAPGRPRAPGPDMACHDNVYIPAVSVAAAHDLVSQPVASLALHRQRQRQRSRQRKQRWKR